MLVAASLDSFALAGVGFWRMLTLLDEDRTGEAYVYERPVEILILSGLGALLLLLLPQRQRS
jgi:hypothetical protein